MSQQTQQVIRALSAFQAVAHPYAVTSAFRKAGLSTFWRDGRVFVDVTIYSAKYVRGLNDQDKGEPTALDEGQKIRVDLRHLDWGPRQDRYLDDAGYPDYDSDIADLPIVPASLSEDYVSTIQRDFPDWLLGDISTDEDDDDYVPYESSDDEETAHRNIPNSHEQPATTGPLQVVLPHPLPFTCQFPFLQPYVPPGVPPYPLTSLTQPSVHGSRLEIVNQKRGRSSRK